MFAAFLALLVGLLVGLLGFFRWLILLLRFIDSVLHFLVALFPSRQVMIHSFI